MSEERPLILIVEDEDIQRDSLNEILKEKYNVLLAKTGAEALAHLEANPFKIDLMLLDYTLPDFNAVELMQKIQDSQMIAIPDIVMLTANLDTTQAINAITRGLVFRYLTKPVSKQTLLDTLQETLDNASSEFKRKEEDLSKNAHLNLQTWEIGKSQFLSQFSHYLDSGNLEKAFDTIKDSNPFGKKKTSIQEFIKDLENWTGEKARHPFRQTLLAVEDEPEMLASIKEILELEFNLLTATTGEKALSILSNTPVDIILTDVGLPDMKGTELIKEIKTFSTPPLQPDIVVLTAYFDITTIQDTVTAGAIRYITKPFKRNELLANLQEVAKNRYTKIVLSELISIAKKQPVPFAIQCQEFQEYIQKQPKNYPFKLMDLLIVFKQLQYLTHHRPINLPLPTSALESTDGLREFIQSLKQ